VPHCPICGKAYSSTGYQVLVPELGQSFDRVDCALEARRRSRRTSPELVDSLMEEIERLRAQLLQAEQSPG
jgi:hypothetical protein